MDDRQRRLMLYNIRMGNKPDGTKAAPVPYVPKPVAPVRSFWDQAGDFGQAVIDKGGGWVPRAAIRLGGFLSEPLPGQQRKAAESFVNRYLENTPTLSNGVRNPFYYDPTSRGGSLGTKAGTGISFLGQAGGLTKAVTGAERAATVIPRIGDVVSAAEEARRVGTGTSELGKGAYYGGRLFKQVAGSLAGTAAQTGIEIGQGKPVTKESLAKNAGIGIGFDVVGLPLAGGAVSKIRSLAGRLRGSDEIAQGLSKEVISDLAREKNPAVIKESLKLLGIAEEDAASVADDVAKDVSERSINKKLKALQEGADEASKGFKINNPDNADVTTPGKPAAKDLSDVVVSVKRADGTLERYTPKTPAESEWWRQYIDETPQGKAGKPDANGDVWHISSSDKAMEGYKPITETPKPAFPDNPVSPAPTQAAQAQQDIAQAIEQAPPGAAVSQGVPAATPEAGVPSTTADITQGEIIEPKIPQKIEDKIVAGKKLTPEEATKVETAVAKAEEKAAKANADPNAAPGQQTLVDVPRPEATVAAPTYEELQNLAYKETPSGNLKSISKAELGENGGELQDMLIGEATAGGIKTSRFGGVFKDTLRMVRRTFTNPEVAAKFESVTVDPLIRAQAALNTAINADSAALTQVLDTAGIRGIGGRISKSDREAISWTLRNFSDAKLETKLAKMTDKPEAVLNAAKFMRDWYEENYTALNSVAKEFNKTPIGKRTDYFSQIHDYSGIDGFLDSLFGRGSAPFEYINSPSVGFRFGKTRTGNDPRYIKDALDVFEVYSRAANRFKYLTPAVEQIKLVQQTVASLDQVDKGAYEAVNAILANMADQIGPRSVQGQAGKILTRGLDSAIGKTSRGLIDGSISVAFKNLIPLQGGVTRFGAGNFAKNVIKAAIEYTTANPEDFVKIDGEIVPFLVNREGTEGVRRGLAFKARSVLRAIPQSPDFIMSKALVLSAYDEAGAKGAQAVLNAGKEAGLVIAERTPGLQAGVIADRNPLLRLASQFQTEPLNQFNFLGDIARQPGGKAAVSAAKFIAAGFVLNQAYQTIGLGKPAIDPVGSVRDAINKFQGAEGDSAAEKYKNAMGSIIADFLRVAPFGNQASGVISPVAKKFGITIDPFAGGATRSEGTVLGSSLADLTSGDPRKMVEAAGRLTVPAGGQAIKTIRGAEALIKGKTTNAKGETKYTVDRNIPNIFRALAFGPGATSEGQAYAANGYKNEKQVAKAKESSPATDRSESLKAAFANAKVMYDGKERLFNELSDEEKKTAASQDKNARGIYEQWQAAKTGMQGNDLLPDGISEDSAATLNRLNRLTDKGKKVWVEKPGNLYAQKKAEYEKDLLAGDLSPEQQVAREADLIKFQIAAQKNLKGSDINEYFSSPQGKYELKSQQTKYRLDNDPKYSQVDYFKDQEELYKLNVYKDFSQEAVELYGMSDKNIRAYLSKNPITDKLWNELKALDAAVIGAGLDKNGKLGAEGGNSSRGSGGSGGSSGSGATSAYLANLLAPNENFRFTAPKPISRVPRKIQFKVSAPSIPSKPRVRIKL